jgi:hypothetical protein
MEAGRRRVTAAELVRLAQLYEVPLAWLAGEPVEITDPTRQRLEVAARELAKLKPEDLERLLKLLETLRERER